jgi:hypothetical protein
MELHSGGGYSYSNLWTPLEAGSAASAERFVSDHNVTGI